MLDLVAPIRPAALALLAATLLACTGCAEPSLDAPEYGEIINRVPPHLDKPYPLPELDAVPSTTPAPGPQSSGEEPAAANPD